MPINDSGSSRATARMDLGEALTDFVFDESNLIAQSVLPKFGIAKKGGSITVVKKTNLKRSDALHANGAGFNRIGLGVDDHDFSCKDYGLEGLLTEEDRSNYEDQFDAEQAVTFALNRKILIEREIRVAQKVQNTSTFTGSDLYTDNSADAWSDPTSKIIAQVRGMIESCRKTCGANPNSLAISGSAFSNMLNNNQIIARFPGAPVITAAMLQTQVAAIFGIKNLFVGDALYDGAAEGQDFAATEIWSPSYASVFVQHTGLLSQAGLGRTMSWTKMERTVEQYREEQTESDVFRVRQFEDNNIFEEGFAHLAKIG